LGFGDPAVKGSYILAHYAALLDNRFPRFRKNVMSMSLRVGDPKNIVFCNFHIHTVHIDIIIFFVHQLMHK